MTLIIIRADASLSIGSGHVMRCRTLARELRRRGARITFISRRQDGDLIDVLEHEFPVIALPEISLAAYQGLHGRALYEAWLGCSQEQDAADCLRALDRAGIESADWLVVDHYGLDAAWESHLRKRLSRFNQSRLFVIDDLADRAHQADFLLDQNFLAELTDSRYAGYVPEQCRQLLGPHYALLGSEYPQLHPLLPPRTELHRVLVFFGGVDSTNLTGRALEALSDPVLAHLAVDVVLGIQSPHRKTVAGQVARRPNTMLHCQQSSLAGLIARADLAIGAGGATMWERNCLGLPCFVVAIADNQLPVAMALDQAGHIKLLGDAASVSVEKIREELVEALQGQWTRMSSLALTDGWGAARIATTILSPQLPLQLRTATVADEALLLRWANDSHVRANSFSPEPIAPADHHHWFQAGLDDANRLLLILSDANGCPLGQIRFDRQPSGNNSVICEAKIDLSLDLCARGYGLAAHLVRLGLRTMERHWGTSTEAIAEVLDSNSASQATFARAGFVADSVPAQSRLHKAYTRWRWRPVALGGAEMPRDCSTFTSAG
jgi:UDP-2,4-diacetamido-2,4,6-trideoxy-beta-L-altropyranose hydrolase